MGFFIRQDDEDTDWAQSLERIESGGIPLGAERRLKELAAPGALYTSGLSVNEFALLRRMGPEPLAQVMGASVIRAGYQYLPPLPPGEIVTKASGPLGTWTSQSPGYVNQFTEPSMSQLRSYRWHATEVCELDVLTDAWRTARRRALDRICEEALQVNADAVVGVRLHRSDHDLGQGTIEYVVTGTAVRLPGSTPAASTAAGSTPAASTAAGSTAAGSTAPGSTPAASTAPGSTAANWPVLTDLSVQDYWRLVQAGQEPVGLVATTTVVFASAPVALRVQRLRTLAQNQELEELSKAFRLARETVRAQIEGQVSDAHGAGAVGVTMSHAIHRDKLALGSSLQTAPYRGWNRGRLGLPYYVSGRGDAERRGWVITMHAAGTAVRPRSGPSDFPVKPAVGMGAM